MKSIICSLVLLFSFTTFAQDHNGLYEISYFYSVNQTFAQYHLLVVGNQFVFVNLSSEGGYAKESPITQGLVKITEDQDGTLNIYGTPTKIGAVQGYENEYLRILPSPDDYIKDQMLGGTVLSNRLHSYMMKSFHLKIRKLSFYDKWFGDDGPVFNFTRDFQDDRTIVENLIAVYKDKTAEQVRQNSQFYRMSKTIFIDYRRVKTTP